MVPPVLQLRDGLVFRPIDDFYVLGIVATGSSAGVEEIGRRTAL